ncbi:MAG TPA: GNAT family N-acetyltransferase [Burkholderiaceae bacterium]
MTITIRRASTKDAPAFARMMADPAVYPGLLQMPYASEERWAALLGEGQAAGTPDIHLVAERDGEVIGSAGLHATGKALRRRHAMSMGISVANEAQGQGVGSALMAALCDYADRWLGTLRIELTVYTDNEAALKLYRKFGFEIEGTLRAYAMRDGRYVDAYTMARFHPNPPTLAAGG